jgi:hypothetical protein
MKKFNSVIVITTMITALFSIAPASAQETAVAIVTADVELTEVLVETVKKSIVQALEESSCNMMGVTWTYGSEILLTRPVSAAYASMYLSPKSEKYLIEGTVDAKIQIDDKLVSIGRFNIIANSLDWVLFLRHFEEHMTKKSRKEL